MNYQPCGNVLSSRSKRTREQMLITVFTAIVCLVALFHIIIPGLLCILRGDVPPDRVSGFMSDGDRAEYHRLLCYHGLQYDVAVVEEDADGSLWFWRDGQRCRLQYPAGR